ncbi:MAG: glutathione S-transferase [Henriciella sp.]
MELILGNMNYSSWSIRAALVVRGSGLDIPERIVPLGFAETRETLIKETGSHTVPVLRSGALIIRDSLAIAEWIAEKAAPGRVWPEDENRRAVARSVCAEMHSSFTGLRSQMPVDIRSRHETPAIEGDLETDIERVKTIWATLRAEHHGAGDFLFGAWSAADAFYAPVVTRFRTYGYALEGALADYSDAVWEHKLLQNLRAQAEAEPWEIEMGYLGPARAWVRE